MEVHEDRIATAFTKQATTFEDSSLNTAFTSGLPWIVELSDPRPDDRIIDVAGGTGLVARALASRVAEATVVDATPAMLQAGRVAARNEQRDNVWFCEGDAMSLPFEDELFSLVVNRFVLHHLESPAPALEEMVRVASHGGRLVVMDLVSDPDPGIARRQDEIERLRDDSHLTMPQESEVGRWLEAAGCTVGEPARRSFERPLDEWFEQALTPQRDRDAIRDALRIELDGGPATGMRPHVREGELWFGHTWEATVAHRE